MPTQGSHCELPANDIIEPLTFAASKMAIRGKVIVFQSRFPYLACTGTFSSGNRVWVKPSERNVQQKKKKRNKTEEQAPMHDYREALLADRKLLVSFVCVQ